MQERESALRIEESKAAQIKDSIDALARETSATSAGTDVSRPSELDMPSLQSTSEILGTSSKRSVDTKEKNRMARAQAANMEAVIEKRVAFDREKLTLDRLLNNYYLLDKDDQAVLGYDAKCRTVWSELSMNDYFLVLRPADGLVIAPTGIDEDQLDDDEGFGEEKGLI